MSKIITRKKVLARSQDPGKRLGDVFVLLKQGKTTREVAQKLGISLTKVCTYKRELKGRHSLGEVPSFLLNGNVKQGVVSKAVVLLDLASEAIESGQRLSKEKRPYFWKNFERIRKAVEILKSSPLTSNSSIAKKVGLKTIDVLSLRESLIRKKRIPNVDVNKVNAKKVQRDPNRITNVLNKSQRTAFLEKKSGRIMAKARFLMGKYPDYFLKRRGMNLEDIFDDLVDKLDWKLETFRPRENNVSQDTQLERHFSRNLSFLTVDLSRHAAKFLSRHANEISISPELLDKRTRGPIPTTLEVIDSFGSSLFLSFDVRTLNALSEKINLTPVEKAVLFARSSGMETSGIGRALGYTVNSHSCPRVSQIWSNIEKKANRHMKK